MVRAGVFALSVFIALPVQAAEPAPAKIKLLVVTGGHGFKAEPFFKVFDDNPDVAYLSVAESNFVDGHTTPGQGAEAWDRDDLHHFDVVLLYDFQRSLTDAQQARFLALFDRGVGLIVLHHALLSYQQWPEYERIAGGKYLLSDENLGGAITRASTYQGDVDIAATVVAHDHPVTAGLQDFTVRDEIYRGVRTGSDITPLLIAEGKPLAWARQEKNSRIVGIIIGHGPAYADANFQKLLAQSIRWAARTPQAER